MKKFALVLLVSVCACALHAQRFPFTEIRRAGAGTTATATNAIAWDASGVGTNTTLYSPYILNGTFTNCSFFDVILPGEIATDLTGYRVVVTDEDGILTVTDTTSTELGYVHNVRAAIQTQLDTITNGGYHTNIIVSRSWLTNCYLTNGVIGGGYASNIISYNGYFTNAIISKSIATNGITVIGDLQTAITASRAIATDATSNLVASATTATELGYVSGVSSAIQTQLDGKLAETNGFATNLHVIQLLATNANVVFQAPLVTNSLGNASISLSFLQVPFNLKVINVSNNFELHSSDNTQGACMAIKLVPENFGTNYTIDLDNDWQLYGANFTSDILTLKSNKSIILSLTCWEGTTDSYVAAAFKEQQ